MSDLHILIPCKALAAGKSRLASLLPPEARQALCATFLGRTLALAAGLVGPGAVTVVTSDPDAATRARTAGAWVVADPARGLNDALAIARDTLLLRGQPIDRLLVLPIDLPCATRGALEPCLTLDAEIALAPDRRGDGTNLLCLRRSALAGFTFRYGPGSFAAHCRSAAGRRIEILRDARLAFDIDRPEDYRLWRRGAPAEPWLAGKRPAMRGDHGHP